MTLPHNPDAIEHLAIMKNYCDHAKAAMEGSLANSEDMNLSPVVRAMGLEHYGVWTKHWNAMAWAVQLAEAAIQESAN